MTEDVFTAVVKAKSLLCLQKRRLKLNSLHRLAPCLLCLNLDYTVYTAGYSLALRKLN